MRTPHFLRLAQIDEQHFIMACRSGLVHLTWGRATVRLTRGEFRRLGNLLQQATETSPPSYVRDGLLSLAYRRAEESELRLGSLILVLSAAEVRELAGAAQRAVHHLDEFLASGAWERDEAADDAPSGFGEQVRRNPFSQN